MKLNRINKLFSGIALTACLAIGFAQPAGAQVRGFDVFQNMDVIAIPGTNLLGGIIGNYTNQPIYVLGKDGGARMDFYDYTNAGVDGVLSVTVQGSPDLTNWTSLGSYGSVTNYATQTNGNHFYGGTLLATNNALFPYTVTTPTASSAGFATVYNAPIQYTNSGILALQPGYNSIGFSAQDCPKYLRLIWSASGSITNHSFGAELMTTITR